MEINGIQYKEIEVKENPKMSRKMTMLLGMAMIFEGQGNLHTSKAKKEPLRVDLIEEFRLIQEKKSKLSRAERESIIYRFNRKYLKVE